GPTFDRRCKPDIVAPGNCLVPAANENSEYYPSGNWSSYAAPTVAGAAALLIQKAKLNKTNLDLISSTGGNCIIKTILLNSATKLPFWHKGLLTKDDDHSVPLDYIQGAGLLNAVKAHDILDAGRQEAGFVKNIGWDKNRLEIDKEFEKVYHIHLDNPEKKIITATAAWNLHYNKKYPFEITEEKNSNLSLELWALDVNDPNRSLLIDYSDSYVDNVEHIHCKTDPNFTDYDLVISYSTNESIDIQNEGEDYAIAWNIDESPAEKQDILWYDLDTNGIVDEKDLEIIFGFAKAVLESGSDISFGDINGDGKIDLDDISILFEQNNRQAKWFND
ncbi:MAG: S8 family serine peptidase, partial [Planctomycetes bacterium]|nr:S8 family serine peptidase [Planctomycetota bacterium]